MKQILGRVKGGVRYSELTNKQMKEVEEGFYGRKVVKAEKEYRYFFNESGKCVMAT